MSLFRCCVYVVKYIRFSVSCHFDNYFVITLKIGLYVIIKNPCGIYFA